MTTLHIDNFPDDLFEALKKRAQESGRSVAAEVVALLETRVSTEKELRRRRELLLRVEHLRSSCPTLPEGFPTAEEMIREDRDR
jgi:plasmid stability protein